jgi:hypothetical protein
MLSLVPGVATFDILSDEFSPYATIIPNAGTALFQPTDIDNIFLKFTDFADSVPEPGAVAIISIGLSLLWLKRRTQAHGRKFLITRKARIRHLCRSRSDFQSDRQVTPSGALDYFSRR